MYIFSVTAKAKTAIHGFEAGHEAPFIVYIDFKDLIGAEQLARLFVMKEGFYEVVIEKRRRLTKDKVIRLKRKDQQIKEALETGYAIQLFDEH
ncbi:hypothetical protein [Marinibactrum halimedae]|uniref:Uncharacterized protein n=1 Tax=Marinibactrum halimedae TaxID=1444977 RepID=A0AA37T0W2_9GAMM|nr:hypothetical protein [Marinibactrum halimedae]MCD9457802.1 hypothetical protein [Marinibactrum halimedae]GLS24824.1 hypothetical protein GCM10007877_05380 [Marinibactrum halimedae]